MKKTLLFFICFLLLKNISFCQGWVGDGSSMLYAVNSDLNLSPIKVGIGTSTPTQQFHTTGGVRFQGLSTNNAQTHVVVADASGNLYFRDLSTISTTNAWLTTGNALTGSEFIGTTNAYNFNIRTNNIQRMVVGSNGNIAVNSTDLTPSKFSVSSSTEDFQFFASGSSPSYVLSQKTFREDPSTGSTSPFGTLGLATRTGAFASYANVGDLVLVNYNQNSIIFATQARQTINNPSGNSDEKMIITGIGNVGIGTRTPTAILDVAIPSGGDIRFENLPSGGGNILTIDANGYVHKSSSQASIIANANNSEISDLKSQIKDLQSQINDLKAMVTGLHVTSDMSSDNIASSFSTLGQNIPNPSRSLTQIPFHINGNFRSASIQVYELATGKILQIVPVQQGQTQIPITTNNLANGTYFYSLIVDGKTIGSKKLSVVK